MLVPRGKGLQLVSLAGRGLYAYDPKTGKELWRMRHRGWSVALRPIYGHGLIFATIDRDVNYGPFAPMATATSPTPILRGVRNEACPSGARLCSWMTCSTL